MRGKVAAKAAAVVVLAAVMGSGAWGQREERFNEVRVGIWVPPSSKVRDATSGVWLTAGFSRRIGGGVHAMQFVSFDYTSRSGRLRTPALPIRTRNQVISLLYNARSGNGKKLFYYTGGLGAMYSILKVGSVTRSKIDPAFAAGFGLRATDRAKFELRYLSGLRKENTGLTFTLVVNF